MSKYIGAPVVSLSTDTVDVTGDITTTDATPEVIIVNDTHEDTDGGREGKVTFKGQQSGGEETTLAEIQASHDGTSDDEKGDLIFKTNDGSDGASPTERFRIDSLGRGSFGTGTSGVPSGFWNNATYKPYYAIENNGLTGASTYVTLGLLRHTADSEAAQIGFAVSRGTTTDSKTIVQDGDSLGTITWQGADGSEYCEGARINIAVDGTPGANDMPSRMQFFTTADGAQTPTERMRIDSSGRVGIGGAPNTNWRNDLSNQNVLMLGTAASLFSDGNLTTELWNNAYVDNSDTFKNIATAGASRYFQYNGAHKWFTAASASAGSTITSEINTTPKMILDVSGNFIHGKSSLSEFTKGSTIELNSGGGRIVVTGNGGTGGALFLGNSTTGNVGLMRENGDFECINNSYTGFSDQRLKENIEDSGSQWDDIKALRVRKFSFIRDEVDAPDKIGVIAQELEASGMSGLVSTNPDLSNPEETTKSVKYSILYMKAVKALQEAMTRIETLETQNTTQATQIADLITRVTALEGE